MILVLHEVILAIYSKRMALYDKTHVPIDIMKAGNVGDDIVVSDAP